MEYKDILSFLTSKEIEQLLFQMSFIHKNTKHYLLIAEELFEEDVAYLQPLKEHRDAEDHLMRIFYLMHDDSVKDIPMYILDNIKKALGHEYRAFFDTADWLTFICRKNIREYLSIEKNKRKYEQKYNDFNEIKDLINNLPFIIAEYRENKDIGNRDNMLQDVKIYINTLKKLLELYKRMQAL